MTSSNTATGGTSVRRLGYQPALDGLRAVAVLAVLLYHDTALELLPGGFLGVDVFLVLSGFLITTILVSADAEHGSAVSRQFWVRRVRRLLPAFLFFMLLVSALTVTTGDIADQAELRAQGLASMAYVLNWYVIFAHNHYVFTEVFHTWSLSVEEQWYLVWPFLLTGLLMATGRRWRRLLVVVAVLAVASAVLMAVLAEGGAADLRRASLGTDTRAWELLAGAGLAVVMMGRGIEVASQRLRAVVDLVAIGGMVTLVVAFCTVSELDSPLYPGLRIVVVLATLAVVIGCVQRGGGGLLRRMLSWPPLIGIGLISYGLYLYHLPLFHAFSEDRTGLDGAALLTVRLAVAIGFATLSYRLVERPIRRGSAMPIPGRFLAPAAMLVVAVVFIAATRYPAGAGPDSVARRGYQSLAASAPDGTTRVLVAGDESALRLVEGFGPSVVLNGTYGVVAGVRECSLSGGRAVTGRRGPRSADCRTWSQAFEAASDGFDPAVAVLVLSRKDLFDQQVGGRTLRAGSPELTRRLRRQLERTWQVLTARRRPLVLVSLPCTDPAPRYAGRVGAVLRDPPRRAWVNAVAREFAAAHPADVHFADLNEVLCPNGNPHGELRSVPLRPDGVKLSQMGRGAIWLWLSQIVERLDVGQ